VVPPPPVPLRRLETGELTRPWLAGVLAWFMSGPRAWSRLTIVSFSRKLTSQPVRDLFKPSQSRINWQGPGATASAHWYCSDRQESWASRPLDESQLLWVILVCRTSALDAVYYGPATWRWETGRPPDYSACPSPASDVIRHWCVTWRNARSARRPNCTHR